MIDRTESRAEECLTRTLTTMARTVPDEAPPFSFADRPEPVVMATRPPLRRVAAFAAAAAVVVAGVVGVVALAQDNESSSRIRVPAPAQAPSPAPVSDMVAVPNVVGMATAAAFETLSAAGFPVSTNSPIDTTNTRVVQQSPAGRAQPGTEVVLTLGPG